MLSKYRLLRADKEVVVEVFVLSSVQHSLEGVKLVLKLGSKRHIQPPPGNRFGWGLSEGKVVVRGMCSITDVIA